MHVQTIIVAAVALLSSNVIAQDRPKFYFPRQVKREISNNTSNSVEDSSSSSTKRDIIGDLLGVLTGGSAPATASPVKSIAPVKSVVDVAPGVVKTVIVSNTVVVNNGVTTTLPPSSPSNSAGTAGTTASKVSSVKPPLIVLPSLSLDLPSVLDPILPTKSSADGITGPSGILGSSGAVGPAPTGSTPSGVTYSGTGTGVSSSTDLDYQTLSASSSSSGGGLLSSILSGLNPDPTSTGAGTGTGTGATTTFAPSSSTATPSSSSTGLESMISSIISSGTAGTGSTLFPSQSGTNSTTHRVPPVPTGGDTTSHRGNGTAIVLPPTTTKKPTKPTSLTDIPTTIITTSAEAAPTTSDWVGSSILIQTTQSGEKATTTTVVPSGIPSSLPLVVAPINGTPPAKDGFTLIQVGFTYALNYEFVVANSMSSAQIFTYLPKGIAYGLEIKDTDVVMHSLQPFDTSGTLGYITTLALAYIPDDVVSNLGIMIHVPVSRLYKNPSEPVAVIMSSINPSISITVGSGLDGSNPKAPVDGGAGSTPKPDDKDSGNGNGGIFDNNENNQTPGAKGMTAGIATGAVVAAAAYGAAMFFIARRYKRRKLSHRRARSVMNPAEMAEASGSAALPGGVYMSGGRQSTGSGESGSGSSAGNSARTAQISAPMMAENSLGWN